MLPEDVRLTDAPLPVEMALLAVETGVKKAQTSTARLLVLSILAGAFIAFGAIFSTLVTAGSTLSFGITRLLAGMAFSLGLILVVVGGAELFTGNNLMVMAWAGGRLKILRLLYNWIVVYTGNMLGAFSLVIMIFISRHYMAGNGVVGQNMLSIAGPKCELDFLQALVLGILCNILVCLAVWLCYSARSAHGKILALLFPITAFVAAGFEHSVANMYFIPMGLAVKEWAAPVFWQMTGLSPDTYGSLSMAGYFYGNLLPVTLGNILGGGVFVGLAYWFIYLRKSLNLNRS
jgi:formate transporter